jgi:GAF domain-containing protein
MAPIIARGETVGLLEVYRNNERPWTSVEIDNARLLAQSAATAMDVSRAADRGQPLPWSPEALGASAPGQTTR